MALHYTLTCTSSSKFSYTCPNADWFLRPAASNRAASSVLPFTKCKMYLEKKRI